jgi:hypothetical protein
MDIAPSPGRNIVQYLAKMCVPGTEQALRRKYLLHLNMG